MKRMVPRRQARLSARKRQSAEPAMAPDDEGWPGFDDPHGRARVRFVGRAGWSARLREGGRIGTGACCTGPDRGRGGMNRWPARQAHERFGPAGGRTGRGCRACRGWGHPVGHPDEPRCAQVVRAGCTAALRDLAGDLRGRGFAEAGPCRCGQTARPSVSGPDARGMRWHPPKPSQSVPTRTTWC